MAKQRRGTAPQKPSGSETNEESEVSSTFPNTTEESRSPSPPRAEQRFLSKHHKHCCTHSGDYLTIFKSNSCLFYEDNKI